MLEVQEGDGKWEGLEMPADMDVEIERCAALVVKYVHRKKKGFMKSFYKGERLWDY